MKTPESKDRIGKTGLEFLIDGGALGELISRFDWQKTSLGPIESWTSGLKSSVSLILRSQVPMVLLWGSAGYMIYNDAYAVFAGARHPQLLGSKVLEGWPEVASFNAHVMDVVYKSGGNLSFSDQELVLHRGDRPKTAWMNLDYSPILDDEGKPAGVIAIVVETTAKVIAERWLAGERERQIHMFEQAPGFMAMVTGPNHVFEMANASYRQLAGNRALLGRTVREAFPDIEGQGFIELLDQVYKTGEPFIGTGVRAELQIAPDGGKQDRIIDLIYQPIRNPESEVVGVLAQGVDVTDRHLAEQAVRQSEERMRVLAEAMPHHVWTANAEGHAHSVNSRIYEYSGEKVGAYEEQGWSSVVHPDDWPKTVSVWQEAKAKGSIYETEFRLRRHDGVYRWFISRAVPIRDAAGKVTQWVGTNTDIDEQRRSAQALAESERRLQLAQNAAGIGALELDIATGTVFGSEQFWKIWGLTPRESVHISVLENIVLPEDAAIRSSEESRKNGTAAPHVEYRIERPDSGEIRWLSRDVDFVFDEAGKPIKMFGIMQDVTERKEAELRQWVLTHEMEHRMKNIMAMVSAIASQTLRNTDLETARVAFRDRMKALSSAHDILNHTRWTNASMHQVVQSAIAAFPAERISVSGPPLAITPKMALSMALAVNELGTNAVKYGALSQPGGKAEITWRLEDGAKEKDAKLIWQWRERGGPPVSKPSRQGFGSMLIERVLGADFGGTMEIDFQPDGISCVLVAPSKDIERDGPAALAG